MGRLKFWQWLLGQVHLEHGEDGLLINHELFVYPEIEDNVSLQSGMMFLTLRWGDKTVRFWANKPLRNYLQQILDARVLYWRDEYQPAFNHLEFAATLFQQKIERHNRYLRTSQLTSYINDFSVCRADFKHEEAFKILGFQLTQHMMSLKSFLVSPNVFQARFNETWVSRQLEKNKTLFDHLEEHPLTEKQRLSCITDEDNLLVLAGAGTGKTSTMVAKAKYLVSNGFAAPHEIMMLAYGSDAQKELQARIDDHVELSAVKVSTFHSAGKRIINFHEKNSVSQLATDEKVYARFVETQIQEMLKSTQEGEQFSRFVTSYLYPKPNGLDFKTHGEYLRYVKDNELRALSGDLVKSFEELTIANYLFSNGIRFEYERPYPFEVSGPGRSVYQPDFYLPDLDVYLEHFGINKLGEPRAGIDAKQYNEDIIWKRNKHKLNNTSLWETYSWQSHEDGGLTHVLEKRIQQYCLDNELDESQVFNSVTPTGIYNRLKDLGLVSHFSSLIANFLSLFKASSVGLQALRVGELDKYNLIRWELFKKLFTWVYNRYQSFLNANQMIDFADMINKATIYAEQAEFHQKTQGEFRLKYLLVDEFQDISPIRASLIKAVRQANESCALMGVGDDWQAIYRFTGSDVTLTTNFETHFGASEILQLDKTFRFNDRIEKVASKFVQTNPAQIPKQLTTHVKSYNPEVCIISNRKDEAINSVLDAIGTPEPNIKPTVLLLSRFKRSLPDIPPLKKLYPYFEFKAMSAHGSKGKQADYVIVLDVIEGKWGFPSKVETDSILLTLLPKLDDFKHAEERRLFYVALSRAKKTVFVHTEVGRESEFIRELKQYNDDVRLVLNDLSLAFVESARCPECLEGNLVPIEGKYGLFYACSLGKHYCKTIVRVCPKCQTSPIIPMQTYFECASAQCGHKVDACPSCSNGMLVERTNSKDDSKFYACSNFRGNEIGSCKYTKSICRKF